VRTNNKPEQQQQPDSLLPHVPYIPVCHCQVPGAPCYSYTPSRVPLQQSQHPAIIQKCLLHRGPFTVSLDGFTLMRRTREKINKQQPAMQLRHWPHHRDSNTILECRGSASDGWPRACSGGEPTLSAGRCVRSMFQRICVKPPGMTIKHTPVPPGTYIHPSIHPWTLPGCRGVPCLRLCVLRVDDRRA
jgi:hypothetical protein